MTKAQIAVKEQCIRPVDSQTIDGISLIAFNILGDWQNIMIAKYTEL